VAGQSKLGVLTDPARLRAAINRRWFNFRLDRLPTRRYAGLVDVGSEWGGWVVPADLIDDSWICYCVGAGSDISFDLGLIKSYGARVRCLDPFEIFRQQAEEKADGDPRFSFKEVALAEKDGPLTMYGARDPLSGSLSAVNLYESERATMVEGRTLSSLMEEFGDDRADLLKLDIEGSEYEILPTLDLSALGVRVLCVEIHPNHSVAQARRLLDGVTAQGYGLVNCKHPTSYTFMVDTDISATEEAHLSS
jgi:FkbM family methyltransferase